MLEDRILLFPSYSYFNG